MDYLTKTTKVNEGEVQQYYIEESHEAIIDPTEWDAVQDEMKRRKEIGKAYSGKSVLSTRIVCGDCGGWYGPKTRHSNDKYKTVVWQCSSKFEKGKPQCETPHISEDEIKERFLKAYNGLIESKAAVIAACKAAKERFVECPELQSERDELLAEMNEVTDILDARAVKGRAIDRFLRDISGREELLTEFDAVLWMTVIDSVTVRRDGVLVFRFHDGREIEG